MNDPHEEQTGGLQGFPGGRVRLPRLNVPKKLVPDDAEGPETEPTSGSARGEGNAGGRAADRAQGRPSRSSARDRGAPPPDVERDVDGGFLDYFSTESLFGASDEARVDDGDKTSTAYAVLGLTRQASWKEVSQAHRELVAMLHPDRYVDAEDTLREAAERRVRDVNEAYALLRKQRNSSRT